MVAVLRLDFSGCGISDGDFRFTTIENQYEDFLLALNQFKKKIKQNKINIFAHSLGACILAKNIKKNKKEKGIEKIILMAPVLNQKALLRYWFTKSKIKKDSPKLEIAWNNYKKYLNEDLFQQDCKITKKNYINPEYFLSIKDIDFSNEFENFTEDILHIHESNDVTLPIKI